MKKTRTQKPRLSLLLSLVLLAAMVLSLAACSTAPSTTEESPTPPVTDAPSDSPSAAPTELGEGKTQFSLEVVNLDGETTNYTINTDEKTVGAALLALDLIAGDEGEYGLYVKSVGGVAADFDTDGSYWAFYIDGEYATAGIDATDITAGSAYSLKIEK